MDGASKKPLTNEDMLAQARAFQNEVNRSTDRRGDRTSTNVTSSGRGFGGMSSPLSGAYGSGDRNAARTPRGVSSQPATHKLATPEQLFGLPSRLPASVSEKASSPITRSPAPRPIDNSEPMQIDSHSGVPPVNKTAKEVTGRGLVGSRWATSVTPNTASHTKPVSGSDDMDVDTELHVIKKVPASNKPPSAPNLDATISKPTPASSAQAVTVKNTGNAGFAMNNGKSFNSSSKATLDTPEASSGSGSKGLLSSRWAFAIPSSPSPVTTQYPDPATLEPSPVTTQYPDPATLEPVYRSKDWLSDLSEEYKALNVKTENAAETQSTRPNPTAQSAGTQNAAQKVKPPPNIGATAQPQHFGQAAVNFSAPSRVDTSVQPAVPKTQNFDSRSGSSPTGLTGGSASFPKQPVQQNNTKASAAVEPSRSPASTQAVSDQPTSSTTNTAPGGIFNDSAFKDWYNSQFMQRKV